MKSLLNDALKYGAILGIIMGLSRIYETWSLFIDDNSGISTIFMLECLVSIILFVWVIYRAAKSVAIKQDVTKGFSYMQALSFILIVTMLAGVLVGVMYHVYIGVVGYDRYVAGYLSLIDGYESMLSQAGIKGMYDSMFAEMRDMIRESEPQTIFSTIFSSMYSYMISGMFVGLIVSAFVRRDPESGVSEEQ